MGRLETDDGNGNTTRIVRDGSGRPQYIDAPFGQRTALSYDVTQHLSAVTNSLGAHEMAYHSGTQTLATFKKPTSAEWSFLYTEKGNLAKDTDPAGGFKELSATGQAGDFSVTLSTAEGRTTTYRDVRSATDLTRTTTAPDQTVTTESIGDNGATITNLPDGTVIARESSPDPRWGRAAPFVRRLSVKTPSGLDRVVTETRSATLTAPTDPFSVQQLVTTSADNGDTWTSTYAGATRTTTLVSPLGRTRSATVDARGRVTQVAVNGLMPIQLAYDGRGRIQSISQGSGADVRTATFTYRTEDGFLGTVTGPLSGQESTIDRDAAGRAISVTDAVGAPFEFSFDGVGDLASITPPGRAPWSLTYTPVDLLRSVVAPPLVDGQLGSMLRFDYSPDQNLKLVTNPGNRTISYDYDPTRGRLTHSMTADASWDYAYAANGTLSTVTRTDTSGTHTLAFARDGLLETRQTWGGSSGVVSGAVERVYDKYFRVTTQRVLNVNGDNVRFTYDKDGLLTVAASDRVGNLTLTRSLQNGIITSTTQQLLNSTHTINAFGEPDVFTLKRGSTVLFVEDVGERDKAGRILDRSEQALNGMTLETKNYGYGYGLTGRLEHVTVNGAQVADYVYDGNGNRERWNTPAGSVVGRYDAEDRLSRYCPETIAGDPSPDPLLGLPCNSYTYRASGELATKTEIGTSRVTQYDYDELGSLRRVSLPDGRVLDYELDPQGRRIGKKVNGVRQWGLLYQGSIAPAAKLDAANNVVEQFIYASKSNVPDFMIRVTDFGYESYRLVTDHLGSVRLVVRTNDGSIAQRIEYDEFGKVLADTNPGFQPFGFAGGLYDADTGLVRFGARDYDAVTGRWTARDPILFGGGTTNLYEYVGGDPVNRVDPSGLATLHYWEPAPGSKGDYYGHVSVTLDDGTYISYWPNTPVSSATQSITPRPPSYYWDRKDENRDPVNVYISGLDEASIKRWWDKHDQGPYMAGFNNCSDVARDALRYGGLDLPIRLVDGPGDLFQDVVVSLLNR